MSMKRSKKSTGSTRSSQSEGSLGFSPPAAVVPTWDEAVSGREDSEFIPWVMTRTFARNELVVHGKFGKGIVLAVDGPRIEVLFSDTVRKLAHGISA